jgi:CpeT protein
MKSKIVLFILFLVSLQVQAQEKVKQKDLKKLLKMMIGSFTSEEQHKKDTANYYNIRLHMSPIWKDKKDGYWIYVEQAVATKMEKPYRQRVYHVSVINDTTIQSKIYLLNDPLRFAGVWKEDKALSNLSTDS